MVFIRDYFHVQEGQAVISHKSVTFPDQKRSIAQVFILCQQLLSPSPPIDEFAMEPLLGVMQVVGAAWLDRQLAFTCLAFCRCILVLLGLEHVAQPANLGNQHTVVISPSAGNVLPNIGCHFFQLLL